MTPTPRMSKSLTRKMRMVVFPRDNWTCQECGVTIRPTNDEQASGLAAPTTGRLTLELDHVLPRRFGGPSTPNNLRAACNLCNGAKRARLYAASWEIVISEAVRILTTREPCRDTALRAIRVLQDVR